MFQNVIDAVRGCLLALGYALGLFIHGLAVLGRIVTDQKLPRKTGDYDD